MQIRKAKTFKTEGTKIFLHGDSGSGKTAAACTAPSPIFLLTEPQGIATIRHFAPEADVVEATTMATVTEFMRAAQAGGLGSHETIVIDSLTEIQRLMKDDIGKGRPALSDFSQKDWSELTERMRRFFRYCRNLPSNVVATALAVSEVDEGEGKRYIKPQFMGKKLPNEIIQYFSLAGYCYRTVKRVEHEKKGEDTTYEDVVDYKIMLSGPSTVLCKPCYPIEGIEKPELTRWIRTLADGAAAQK